MLDFLITKLSKLISLKFINLNLEVIIYDVNNFSVLSLSIFPCNSLTSL